MACGMTPEFMNMLLQMQHAKEEQVASSTKEYEAIKESNLRLTKSTEEKASHVEGDWTATYRTWDQWVDPEELAKKEEDAKKRLERAQQRTMCNHDHSAERKLMDKSVQEKLLDIQEFRLLGNAYFVEGQYPRAAYYYHRGLIIFEYIFTENDNEEKQVKELKVKVLLNYSACRLKCNCLDDAINHCSQVLDIDPGNVKALFRRGKAYRMLDDYDRALVDLNKAIELSPSDKEIRNELTNLRTKQLAYEWSSKKVYHAMFQGKTSHKRVEDPFKDKQPSVLATQVNIAEAPQLSSDSLETWKPISKGGQALEALLNVLNGDPTHDLEAVYQS